MKKNVVKHLEKMERKFHLSLQKAAKKKTREKRSASPGNQSKESDKE